MYIILLHISGIAIVEILFFFEYIGPIETKIFTDALRNVMDQSINENMNFIMLNPNITNLIDEYINIDHDLNNNYTTNNLNNNYTTNNLNDDIDNREDLNNYMEELNSEGIHKREKSTNELFIRTVIYWAIGFAITLIITFIQLKIRSYRKNNTLDKSASEQSIELVRTRLRTTSVDTEYEPTQNDIENNETIENMYLEDNDDKKKFNCIKIRNKILYYMFGVCLLLGFQYSFFQYVALKYEPLSSYELQYIIYKFLYKDINVMNDIIE